MPPPTLKTTFHTSFVVRLAICGIACGNGSGPAMTYSFAPVPPARNGRQRCSRDLKLNSNPHVSASELPCMSDFTPVLEGKDGRRDRGNQTQPRRNEKNHLREEYRPQKRFRMPASADPEAE
jgi:hypothetical protein